MRKTDPHGAERRIRMRRNRVYHWNLPGNPVDLEQREGRVHRFKGHAVRLNVAHNYGDELFAIMECIAPGRLGSRGEFIEEWCKQANARFWPSAVRTSTLVGEARTTASPEEPRC